MRRRHPSKGESLNNEIKFSYSASDFFVQPTKRYRIQKPPPTIGYWRVGGNTLFSVTRRPTDEQIKNTEALLGWEWQEVKP